MLEVVLFSMTGGSSRLNQGKSGDFSPHPFFRITSLIYSFLVAVRSKPERIFRKVILNRKIKHI
jgi:hypothetical protein